MLFVRVREAWRNPLDDSLELRDSVRLAVHSVEVVTNLSSLI